MNIKNNKKADLSIGIIIAAAIGVLVLVVVGAVFINQMRNTTQDINDCAAIGAEKMDTADDCINAEGQVAKYLSDDTPDDKTNNPVCCIKLD